MRIKRSASGTVAKGNGRPTIRVLFNQHVEVLRLEIRYLVRGPDDHPEVGGESASVERVGRS